MSEQRESISHQMPVSHKEGKELRTLNFIALLTQHKTVMLGMPIFGGAAALIGSFLMTPIFVSTTRIMPPQQQQGLNIAAMVGQLGGLATAAGSGLGLKNPNDLYIGMLQSRTVEDNLISRFKLKERYEEKTMDETRKELENVTKISAGKTGLISIDVEDKDPQFAATLANAYVEELAKLSNTLAISEASKRRLFFENQLKAAKNQLVLAEVAMRKTQEATGLLQPNGQVQEIIAATARLKATLAAKEVQASAMRTFATAQNPEMLRLTEEIHTMKTQLEKLQKGGQSKDGDPLLATKAIPEAGLEYFRTMREVKYQETLFEMLSKQYELAKIDEAKEAVIIQQLDTAIPADKKSKPKRALFAVGGIFVGALLGFILALWRESRLWLDENPKGTKGRKKLINAWNGTDA